VLARKKYAHRGIARQPHAFNMCLVLFFNRCNSLLTLRRWGSHVSISINPAIGNWVIYLYIFWWIFWDINPKRQGNLKFCMDFFILTLRWWGIISWVLIFAVNPTKEGTWKFFFLHVHVLQALTLPDVIFFWTLDRFFIANKHWSIPFSLLEFNPSRMGLWFYQLTKFNPAMLGFFQSCYVRVH